MSPQHSRNKQRRLDLILRYVAERREASFVELAEHFAVSQMTVYRDVEQLERMAAVRRVPGGVTSQPSSVFESSLQYRQTVHREEKHAIARAAATMVEPGMSIMLDDGTTIAPMIADLVERAPLTVISAFTPVLDALRAVENIELIVLGGVYRARHDCVVGTMCENMIRHLRADICFMSPSAIDRGELLHQEQEMVGVKRAMLASCRRRVLLSDHSKLGRSATHQVASVADFDRVFVDARTTSEQLAHVDGTRAEVTVVPLAVTQ